MSHGLSRKDQEFMGATVRKHLNTEYQDDERFFRMSRIIQAVFEQRKTWHLPYLKEWFRAALAGEEPTP